MGQAQSSSVCDSYAPTCDILTGTYRIVHDATDKVLHIHPDHPPTIVLRPRLEVDEETDPTSAFLRDQEESWFILRSGDGFVFKHGRQETYLTGQWSTAVGPQPARATRYPTTWAIHTRKGTDVLKHVIMVGNESAAGGGYLGLVGVQKGVCLARLSETEENDQMWRLERIGDATIEEGMEHRLYQLERRLAEENAAWAAQESTLRTMLRQLDDKESKLQTISSELDTQARELGAVRDELCQQTAQLKQKYKALDAIRELLDAKERALSEKASRSEGGAVCEKDPEGYRKEGMPPSLDAPEGVVDQRPTLVVHLSQGSDDTNNISMSNAALVERPPVSAPVEQRLAALGWSFD